MSGFIKLSLSTAFPLWNEFTSSLSVPTPFSFNPSLFYFYQKHFNWKSYYFIIYDKEKIVGLFPVVDTGKAIVSLPHFSYGGFIEIEKSAVSKGKLIRYLLSQIIGSGLSPGFYKVIYKNDVNYPSDNQKVLFIRSFGDQRDENFKKSEKVTFMLNLKDKEAVFNSLSSNIRRKIRRASKERFEIKTGDIELLDDFYGVYSRNIFFLKSLNYSKNFFEDLFSAWNYGDIKFFVVYKDNKPVAGALMAAYNGFYENMFFATFPEVRKFYISDWLHWQIIKYIIVNSSKLKKHIGTDTVYSFGRSTEFSTVYSYKSHWPVSTVPLFVYSDMKTIKQNSLLKKVWANLPCFIARPLGAKLINHIY